MQVYVHLAGKNYGPYSIDQLRQYVQAGSFKDDNLACYDGTNWVKIKDVPGLAVVAKKAKPVQQKAQQKAPQKNSPPGITKLEILRRVSGFAIWAVTAWIIIKLDTDVLWIEMAFNARFDGSRLIKQEELDALIIVGWIITTFFLHRMVNRIFLKVDGQSSDSKYRSGYKID
jgi:hypothetical protein